MVCKKCGISEMDCDCSKWSAEAQEVFKTRAAFDAEGHLVRALPKLPPVRKMSRALARLISRQTPETHRR
jgi:hypothetical protein